MTGTSDTSTLRSVHRLVEHYTPDGTLGRTLLGGTVLLFSPYLFFGSAAILFGSGFLPAAFVSIFTMLLGAVAFPFGLMVLWPVYLSLIGNLDTAADYPDGSRRPTEMPESSEAVLKRRYAAGELSREEFERRLDDVMETGQQDRPSRADDAHLEASRSR